MQSIAINCWAYDVVYLTLHFVVTIPFPCVPVQLSVSLSQLANWDSIGKSGQGAAVVRGLTAVVARSLIVHVRSAI